MEQVLDALLKTGAVLPGWTSLAGLFARAGRLSE
jgi:hypothetical protein